MSNKIVKSGHLAMANKSFPPRRGFLIQDKRNMNDKKFILKRLRLHKHISRPGYKITIEYSNEENAIEITLPDELSDFVFNQISECLIKTSKIAANTLSTIKKINFSGGKDEKI